MFCLEQDKFDTKHGKKLKEPACESAAAAGGKKNNRACENGGKKMSNKSATTKRSDKSEAKGIL